MNILKQCEKQQHGWAFPVILIENISQIHPISVPFHNQFSSTSSNEVILLKICGRIFTIQ